MVCSVCGTENEPGRKFCGECGAPLALVCGNCGGANSPGMKFCGECGSPLATMKSAGVVAAGNGPVGASAAVGPAPISERRLVSVLFADLVGFTTLSESRDPEEVRELLTRYFETSRRVIERYGGSVEKFIGDAVMAVWGTPVAQEDDAERAVRAALDLVDAVAALGAEVGAPELAARAGVATGEAAVTVGAEGQGMVAGDLVNTASRIQSAAAPGTVLTMESTRRATEAAVISEEAGSHELKGKADPVPLFRAVRVIGGRGGALRSTGLEAPFVGRDRELRLMKELLHASTDERTAHLLSVVGIAGIGKSRLSWELYKYIDGLAGTLYWHRGRCLAYGEGVTYWALAEMIRGRAGIAEGEDAQSAASKLSASIQEHVADPEERRWVEPRLAHLLGLEDRSIRDREDLFAAARLFFERLTQRYPVVMVFEDMQWAEPALVDFIEYLLDWSRNHPLFVLTLARPELADRHPKWAAGRRNFTSLYLEPLSPESMDALLAGLVPGLPQEVCDRILDRAEGVPLYAVETVRMLIDRGLLMREGNEYRPTGPVADLAVPETLHALIAARLDGLETRERRLLQDAAVLGKTFTRAGLASLTGIPEAELEPLLASLVRKEFLSQQADPRSPERGQYGFLQDLVKRVAYETLSKKERKARHLASVAYLEQTSGYDDDEIVEVLAAHLLEAHHLAPDAPDAAEILERARVALERAGRRAESLGATEEAQHHFERAAELADDPMRRAELLERAADMAWQGGRSDRGLELFEGAVELFERAGDTHAAARASARTGPTLWAAGQIDEALRRMELAEAVLADEAPDEGTAVLLHELARLRFFKGDVEGALDTVDRCLEIAEAIPLPETTSQALNTKSLALSARGRKEEALGLLKHALQVALDHDIAVAATRAYVNLSHSASELMALDDALGYQTAGLALARRVGNRWAEWWLLGHLSHTYYYLGNWDAVERTAAEIPDPDQVPDARLNSRDSHWSLTLVALARGDAERAAQLAAKTWAPLVDSADVQVASMAAAAATDFDIATGRYRDALELAGPGVERMGVIGLNHPASRTCWINAMLAALALGDLEEATRVFEVVASRPAGHVYAYLRAHLDRFRAALQAARGETDGVEQGFKSSAGLLRELGCPYDLAVVQTEHHEWLAAQGRADEPTARELALEARATFERLGAVPWIERLDRGAVPAAAG